MSILKTVNFMYKGPIKGVVLDWSGTVIDPFVIAPAKAFCRVFKNKGVNITMEEARGPMGLRKDLHIKKLTENKTIAEKWLSVHGKYPDKEDIDSMYKDFVPNQVEVLKTHSTLIPGVLEMAKQLRENNIKIGTTTGFTSIMVEEILKQIEIQGYLPDASVAGDDVVNGTRPAPFMLYKNLDMMNVYPIESVVKVDDTVSGIKEGLSAGCWTVGVAKYSNYMNINSMEEFENMDSEEFDKRLILTKKN